MAEKSGYSLGTGLLKSLKNTLVVGVLPALLFALANYTEWLSPAAAASWAVPLGFLSYLLKNYLSNK